MKTIDLRNRTIAIVVSASVAAVLMLGLSPARSHSALTQTTIAAVHGTQVADGSESNGGGSKGGGKGGAKLMELA